MMRTTLFKALLAALLIAALVAFVALDGPHRMSIDALKAQRDVLVQFAEVHRTAAIGLAFGAYAGAVEFRLERAPSRRAIDATNCPVRAPT
jgi:hypothetical protein